VVRAANPIANVSTAGRNLDRGIKFTGFHCVRSGLAAVEPVLNGFAFEGFIELRRILTERVFMIFLSWFTQSPVRPSEATSVSRAPPEKESRAG
jgi:hypothetical protein